MCRGHIGCWGNQVRTVKVLASRRLSVEACSSFRPNVPVRLPLERKEEAQKVGHLRLSKDLTVLGC